MTPEGKVKIWLVGQFQRRYGKKIWSYAPPGGMYGRAGETDRFFCIQGAFVAIEVKQDGKSPTPLQMKRLRDHKENGAIAASMIGKDYAKLNMIFAAVDKRIAAIRREDELCDVRVQLADESGQEALQAPDNDD